MFQRTPHNYHHHEGTRKLGAIEERRRRVEIEEHENTLERARALPKNDDYSKEVGGGGTMTKNRSKIVFFSLIFYRSGISCFLES